MRKKSVLAGAVLMMSSLISNRYSEAADVFFTNDGDFNAAENWSDGLAPSLDLDNHIIQNSFTSTYLDGVLSLRRLIVSDNSPGSFIMTGGDLTLAGGGDSFQIGRGCCGADGFVDLGGTAILRTTENSSIGDRDRGVLHIGPTASVISPGSYWRVGNFGPSVDSGLQGNGLLDVEGSFTARDLFIGVQDGTGVVRISGTGSVKLVAEGADPEADIVDFNHHPVFHPNQSGTIHMVGSNAILMARNLLFDHDPQPSQNLLWFTADSGGVSKITLSNMVNIDNNALRVDLTDYAVAPGQSIVLVDAAPNQVFGGFASYEILGANPLNYVLVYDQLNGNISLMNIIPEPSTAALLGLASVLAVSARRRASR
jgi:PEP-CTERM motif